MKWPIGTRFIYKEDPETPKQWRRVVSVANYINETTGSHHPVSLMSAHSFLEIEYPKENNFDKLYIRLK